jgi:hypothetical protein
VLGQALKQAGKPRIPLVPVVTAANSMELEPKVMLGQQFRELAICGQQSLLFSAGQKKIRSRFGICGPDQNKRIVVRRVWLPAGPKIAL